MMIHSPVSPVMFMVSSHGSICPTYMRCFWVLVTLAGGRRRLGGGGLTRVKFLGTNMWNGVAAARGWAAEHVYWPVVRSPSTFVECVVPVRAVTWSDGQGMAWAVP